MSHFREERRDANKLYNPRPISELSELDPNTPWLEYINKVLTPEVAQVTGEEIIIVDVPEFIIKMSALLERTPARVQANYLMWRVASSTMTVSCRPGRDCRLHTHCRATCTR